MDVLQPGNILKPSELNGNKNRRPPLPPKPKFGGRLVKPVECLETKFDREQGEEDKIKNWSPESNNSTQSLPPLKLDLANYKPEVSKSRSLTKGVDVDGKVKRIERQNFVPQKQNKRLFSQRNCSKSMENVLRRSQTPRLIQKSPSISPSRCKLISSSSTDLANLVTVSMTQISRPEQAVLVVKKNTSIDDLNTSSKVENEISDRFSEVTIERSVIEPEKLSSYQVLEIKENETPIKATPGSNVSSDFSPENNEGSSHIENKAILVKMKDPNLLHNEKMKLEEILELCADYEREIEQEQRNILVKRENHQAKEVTRNIENVGMQSPKLVLKQQKNLTLNFSNSSASPSGAHNANGSTSVGSPMSPSFALTPNRIKTNGSLPREHRNMSPTCGNGIGGNSAVAPPSSPCLFATETEINGIFNFDVPSPPIPLPRKSNNFREVSSPFALENLPPQKSEFVVHSHYMTIPQSPRARIKTFVVNSGPNSSNNSSVETVRENLNCINSENPFLGAGEDTHNSAGVSKEQLYIDAKEVLASIPYHGRIAAPQGSESAHLTQSPNSSFPRRPPRSKHDSPVPSVPPNELSFPSQEASSRLLIGTTMLNGSSTNRSSPVRVISNPKRQISDSTSNQCKSEATIEIRPQDFQISGNTDLEVLTRELQNQMILVSDIKKSLAKLEMKEEEEISGLEIERNLLIAEFETEQEQLEMAKLKMRQLYGKSMEILEFLQSWKVRAEKDIREATIRVEEAEAEKTRLEVKYQDFQGSKDEKSSILEQLKRQIEIVDFETKVHEDLEFNLMEEEASREAEREELTQEISAISSVMRQHENQLHNIENQQRKMLEVVRKETKTLSEQRLSLVRQLEMEKAKLNSLQEKVNDLKRNSVEKSQHLITSFHEATTVGRMKLFDLDDFSLSISDSSDEDDDDTQRGSSGMLKRGSSDHQVRQNRLEILNKSLEADVNRLSVIELEQRTVEKDNVNDGVRSNSRRERSSFNTKASVGTNTSSDKVLFHNGSSPSVPIGSSDSVSSEDCMSNSKFTTSESSHRSKDENGKSPQTNSSSRITSPSTHNNGNSRPVSDLTNSNVNSTLNSRPTSDASSSVWEVATSSNEDSNNSTNELRRRSKPKNNQQRPLTRYLPIRNEDFDLRLHIETAGHQIELCKQLVLNSSSCRGYLQKMGSKFKTWNRRWFVFDRNKKALIYYSDKSESRAKGAVYFKDIQEVYVDHLNSVKSSHPRLTFCMKTLDRKYYFIAPSAEAMRIWVDVIFTGAEGYLEFQKNY